MKIAATLIDEITGSAVTADGRHMALNLRDSEAREMTLGIPTEQLPCLIETPPWWNLTWAGSGDGYLLDLTFGAGGELRFALSQPMARAMLATLQAHLDEAAVSGIVGFGA